MEIIRVIKNKNYSTINNEVLRDKNISLKAKGLLITILSLPDDWDLSVSGMAVICLEGRRAIASAINELREFGYIKRTTIKDNNRFAGYEYLVQESPKCGFVVTGNGDTQSVVTQNSTQVSTNIIKPLINKVKNKEVYLPFPFFRNDFKDIWLNEFLPLKKKKKASLSDRAITNSLNKILELSGGNYDTALKILERSVDNGWVSFWALKNDDGDISKPQQRIESHNAAKEILKGIQGGK